MTHARVAVSKELGSRTVTVNAAFAENIARHTVIPKAGHFVPEEQPEALLKELKSFLDN